MNGGRTIDVSHLPASAFDARAPLWWGNLLMIFIETTTVALVLASYYYVARNYDEWPPPRVDEFPVLYGKEAAPRLAAGTANTALLVLSCALMYWTDQAARRKEQRKVTMGLLVMFLVAAATIWLRALEFRAVHFRWDDNAYASVVWTALGLHLTYLLGGALEFFIMLVWLLRHEIDDNHALDVTLAGGYWYWVTGSWLFIYATVYFAPRLL